MAGCTNNGMADCTNHTGIHTARYSWLSTVLQVGYRCFCCCSSEQLAQSSEAKPVGVLGMSVACCIGGRFETTVIALVVVVRFCCCSSEQFTQSEAKPVGILGTYWVVGDFR
jgi:hypothetical protein